jgi:hypothetical protein
MWFFTAWKLQNVSGTQSSPDHINNFCSKYTRLVASLTVSVQRGKSGNTKGRSITVRLTSCLTGLESAAWQLTIFCFYLQNRLIQTNQTGGQWYSDTSPFSIPWVNYWTLTNWFSSLKEWVNLFQKSFKGSVPGGRIYPNWKNKIHKLNFASGQFNTCGELTRIKKHFKGSFTY